MDPTTRSRTQATCQNLTQQGVELPSCFDVLCADDLDGLLAAVPLVLPEQERPTLLLILATCTTAPHRILLGATGIQGWLPFDRDDPYLAELLLTGDQAMLLDEPQRSALQRLLGWLTEEGLLPTGGPILPGALLVASPAPSRPRCRIRRR